MAAPNRHVEFTKDEWLRIHAAARALNTSQREFFRVAVLHACDEVEALGLEERGQPYRQPPSPFRAP